MNRYAKYLLLFFSLSACNPDPSIDLPTDQIDDDLTQTIEAALAGEGLSSLILPESDDFKSIPQDPKNPLSPEKVKLGASLFHETALGTKAKRADGLHTYSCASCHHAAAGFQAGRVQGIGEGGLGFGVRGEARINNPDYAVLELDVQPIRSPSVANVAYQTNMLWNGQFGAKGVNVGTEDWWAEGQMMKNYLGFEGVETQALAAQEVHRQAVDEALLEMGYRGLYDKAFPTADQKVRYNWINTGIAIAAYERTILTNRAPFQLWLKGDKKAMTAQWTRGAILFFGKANCASCHKGPALNSMAFYALGMNDLMGDGVYGSDNSKREHLGRGGFTKKKEDLYKFKVPQLYNLKDSPFYGHGGNFTSIRQVLEYKNQAIPQNPIVPTSALAAQFVPLQLSEQEIDDISAFLSEALYDPALSRYVPTVLPTGYCFPNNDIQSKKELGCN